MTQDPTTPDDRRPDGRAEGGATEAAPTARPTHVLGALDGLDDLPVGDHVARFTEVHDALRLRLDGEPETEQDSAGPDAGPAR